MAASALAIALLALIPGPAPLLVVLAVLTGAVRGAGTLLQATVIADRWGITRYGTLAGWFAAPVTTASALAPFGGTSLAVALADVRGAIGFSSVAVLVYHAIANA